MNKRFEKIEIINLEYIKLRIDISMIKIQSNI